MDIEEQLQRAEERVKALKKRKAEQDLRDELDTLKAKLKDIGNLKAFNIDVGDEDGQSYNVNVVKFDDIISILKR